MVNGNYSFPWGCASTNVSPPLPPTHPPPPLRREKKNKVKRAYLVPREEYDASYVRVGRFFKIPSLVLKGSGFGFEGSTGLRGLGFDCRGSGFGLWIFYLFEGLGYRVWAVRRPRSCWVIKGTGSGLSFVFSLLSFAAWGLVFGVESERLSVRGFGSVRVWGVECKVKRGWSGAARQELDSLTNIVGGHWGRMVKKTLDLLGSMPRAACKHLSL